MIGQQRLQNALDVLNRVGSGASEAFGQGREDFREALKRAYAEEGLARQMASKWNQMMGSNEQSRWLVNWWGHRATTQVFWIKF